MERSYSNIIFIQNPEEGTPARAWLDNPWQGDDDALLDYLIQWDTGDDHDVSDVEPWGTMDDTFEQRGYVVSYNRGLEYVALSKVVS